MLHSRYDIASLPTGRQAQRSNWIGALALALFLRSASAGVFNVKFVFLLMGG